MSKRKKIKVNKPNIFFLLNTINNRLDNMEDFFKLAKTPIYKLRKENLNRLKKLLKKHKIKQLRNINLKKLPSNDIKIITSLLREINKNYTHEELIIKSLITFIVSELDTYLIYLVKYLFNNKGDLFNIITANYSISDLIKFKSIKEAKNNLLEIELSGISRDKKLFFEWLEKSFYFKLNTIPYYSNILEIIERRNLYIHHDGKITKQYILRASRQHDKKLQLKEKIISTPEYIANSILHLRVFIICMSNLIWRNILPKDVNKCDESLDNVIYILLKEEQYIAVINIVNFMFNNSKISSPKFKTILIINRAFALKESKGSNHWKKEIEFIRKKTKDKSFQLAISVLLELYKEATNIMKKSKKSRFLFAYNDWPILKDFRKNPIFLKSYKEIYNKKFQIETEIKNTDKLIKKIESLNLK